MLRRLWLAGFVGVMCFVAVAPADAVTRVGRRLNVFEFGAGYANPVGKYDNFGGVEFMDEFDRFRRLDADRVFDPSYSISVAGGQLRNRCLFTVGVTYTKVNQLDTIEVGGLGYVFPYADAVEFSDFHQWDLRLNFNFQFTDITVDPITPYVGFGLAAGLMYESAPGISTEYDANTMFSLNFGAEFKIWDSPDRRHFMTLASVNSYDLLSSGYRPRNLNIGGAIKIYMRP